MNKNTQVKASIIIITHENSERNYNKLFSRLRKNKFILNEFEANSKAIPFLLTAARTISSSFLYFF